MIKNRKGYKYMNKVFKKSAVLALAAIMTLTMGVASFADYTTPPEVGTKATDKATISVAKDYRNEDGALTADTFNFQITPIEAMNGATEATIPVANMPLTSGETKAIAFSAADVQGKTQVVKGTSFSQMTFTQPGYYLYKVNEVIPAQKKDGTTYDETSYYICVYVVENVDANGDTTDGVYVKEITSWHNDKNQDVKPNLSDIANVTDNGGNEVQDNGSGITFGKVNYTKFVNQSVSQDVIVEKEVKGNLGDRDKAFEFTTVFAGLNPGSTYDVKVIRQGETAEADMPAADLTGNDAVGGKVKADGAGNATVGYKLKADEKVRFVSLPIGATYTTTEAESNHKASYEITGEGADGVDASIQGEWNRANSTAKTALACDPQTVDSVDGTVTEHFVNERNLATITGVPGLDVMAYGFAGLALVMAALFVARRRTAVEDCE